LHPSAQDHGGCPGQSTRPGQADGNAPGKYLLNTQRPVPQTLCDPEVSIYLITLAMIFLLALADPVKS